MKKLMFLISTAGKTSDQIKAEAGNAYQQFQKVHKKSLQKAQEKQKQHK